MASGNIDAWLKELEHAREELFEAVKITRTTDTLITGAFAIGVAFLGVLNGSLISTSSLLVLFGATIISLIFDYLTTLSWTYVYDMHQHGARVSVLERKINEKLGEKIFCWESSASIKLNTTATLHSNITNVINPNVIRGAISIFLYFSFQALICVFIYSIPTDRNISHIWSFVIGGLNVLFISFALFHWLRAMSPSFRVNVENMITEAFQDDETPPKQE